MESALPQYVDRSQPVPRTSRVPWYTSTFPTYAGIFLWVGFYLKLSGTTITFATPALCLLALLLSGIFCFALYFYVPAMLGMKTGYPLYVVGTSTFGTTGGYLIPGLLMGMLQIGWVAVVSSVSAHFILSGIGSTSRSLFTAIVLLWIGLLGWVAVNGIHYVAKVARFINWVPLAMMLVVLWANHTGIPNYQPPLHQPVVGFFNVITIVIGFFASGGAAGADFGMNNRDRRDVTLGGITGIVLGALVAGGISILSVAGYVGRTGDTRSLDYTVAIASVGALAPIMFFLFAAASMVPTCFSSFIASNSFATMIPRVPRVISTSLALGISALLAITGVADNLVGFFGIVAASFGPICGAMMADYLYEGRSWSGPRRGINWAGCIAWATGFLVGIPETIPGLPASLVHADNPACLYSFAVGFLVYLLLARLGFRPPVMPIEGHAAL